MSNDAENEVKLVRSPKTKNYHNRLMELTLHAKEIAEQGRKKRLDPSDEVEIYIAEDVASRTEGLVGPIGVANRLKIMEKKENLSKDQIVIQIAKEIARGALD